MAVSIRKIDECDPLHPGEQPRFKRVHQAEHQRKPIRLPAVLEAVGRAEVEKLRLYSDPGLCRAAERRGAKHSGCSDEIMPGNGSDENLLRTAGLLRRGTPSGLCGHHLRLLRRLVRADARPSRLIPLQESSRWTLPTITA